MLARSQQKHNSVFFHVLKVPIQSVIENNAQKVDFSYFEKYDMIGTLLESWCSKKLKTWKKVWIKLYHDEHNSKSTFFVGKVMKSGHSGSSTPELSVIGNVIDVKVPMAFFVITYNIPSTIHNTYYSTKYICDHWLSELLQLGWLNVDFRVIIYHRDRFSDKAISFSCIL